MGWHEINKSKYTGYLKNSLKIKHNEDILEKDLLLTMLLAEFEKNNKPT